MNMLAHVGSLYATADDSTRRTLLEAFYHDLEADLGDRVDVSGSLNAHVEELKQAERSFRAQQLGEIPKPTGNEEGPIFR